MPRRSRSSRRAVAYGVLAVAAGIGLLLALSYASGTGRVELSNLGDRDFQAGRADRLAARVAGDRRPFVFPDASPNRSRPIYLDHAGGPTDRGWVAILAGTPSCPLDWTGAGYVDCEGTAYPRDGTGLTRYRTYVRDGDVYVDLRTTVE